MSNTATGLVSNYDYDLNGNRQTKSINGTLKETYHWDSRNRLTSLVQPSPAKTYHYGYDYRMRRVTRDESSGGGVNWEATYEAFGTRTTESGTNPDRQKANTKEEDPTGLLNEGFRYRDLETGMFISRDPMGFVDGPNVYSYVQQNPWTKFDPDGLFWSAAINIGFAAWDTYQVATGGISKTEYAGRMALTGAALVADAATGGMGGGMAVRAAAVAARAGKVGQMAVKAATAVDRANTAYETGSALVENGAALAEASSEGDARGMVKAAAGMALEMAGGKKADGALGAISDSQRKTKAEAGNLVEAASDGKKYVTYTADDLDYPGKTYVGRSSGPAEASAAEILDRRAAGHHRNLGPLKLDQESPNKGSIRGREQMVKEKLEVDGIGTVQINGISPRK